jgi:hypothetical protein
MADDGDDNESVADDNEDNLTVEPDDIFVIAPALTDSEVIDYHTVSGSKLYRAATQKLTEPFNVTTPDLKTFMTDFGDRARFSGWRDILDIPKDLTDPDIAGRETTHVLMHYGCITLNQVRDHALS